jgi:exonuclease III
MSLIELPEYKLLILCIYRSPKEEFDTFLNKLEVIQKLLKKDKILILCGDWNIDFLSDNGNLNDFKDLLLRYNLINTVQTTKSTSTLLNVMIINRKYYMEPATVVDLELSDHHAQLLPVLFKNHTDVDHKVLKRYFGEENIKEFKSLSEKLSWQEVFSETEVNVKFKAFMDLVLYQFNIAFPLQLRHSKKPLWKGRTTQGIIMSSKKMRFLNMLQKLPNLTVEVKTYIDKYRHIYKRGVREAKIRENDKHILHAKHKMKAVWQIINRQSGKISSNKLDIKLNWNSEDITHPQSVAELFNSYFSKISEELIKRNGSRTTNPISQQG